MEPVIPGGDSSGSRSDGVPPSASTNAGRFTETFAAFKRVFDEIDIPRFCAMVQGVPNQFRRLVTVRSDDPPHDDGFRRSAEIDATVQANALKILNLSAEGTEDPTVVTQHYSAIMTELTRRQGLTSGPLAFQFQFWIDDAYIAYQTLTAQDATVKENALKILNLSAEEAEDSDKVTQRYNATINMLHARQEKASGLLVARLQKMIDDARVAYQTLTAK